MYGRNCWLESSDVCLLLVSYGFLNLDHNIYLQKGKIIGVYSSQADHFHDFSLC